MKITFLGQGFMADNDSAVGTIIEKLFTYDSYHTFTGITAFASEAGIYGLHNCIQSSTSFKSLNLIVGIDQEGTPKNALEEILNLNINSYIFYQREAPIFHPKIYLFEGETSTSIIIGSSNLTGRGLFNNIESSTLIEFDNEDTDGLTFLKSMKEYYATLFDFSDSNLFKITPEIIQKFVDLKVVPTKRIWLNKQGKKKIENNLTTDFDIPSRKVASIPSSYTRKNKAKEMVISSVEEILATSDNHFLIQNLTEVWKSSPLTERDLTIPSALGTHATGAMLLSKGEYDTIDQRHYFRENVFNTLPWTNSTRKNSEHLEKVVANFTIRIHGENKGTFQLTLTHNPKTDTETYLQNNSVTSLSWGDAKDVIKNKELLGKSLTLYKDNDTDSQFVIEIQ